jgi:hypothetical protein
MSRVGLVFCALYALIIAACVCWAYSVGDPKGHFVILQLPIALQGTLLVSLGLLPILVNLSWFAAYLLIGLPTFMLLYLLSWLIDRLRTRP